MTYKALLIGINYKGTGSQLSGCYNDIINMLNYLKKEYSQLSNDHIQMQSDEDNHTLPTAHNIVKGMQWLLEGAKAGDYLFLHYSGHGAYVRDNSGDEDDGRDETIVPLDYNENGMITDDYLRENLVEKVPAGVKLFCVFDCCHSGTVLDTHFTYEITKNSYRIQKHEQYHKSAGDVVCISGCRDRQTSADTYEDNPETHRLQAQGAMTNMLLALLYENEGKNLSYKRLMYTMCDRLKKHYSQIPYLSSGKLLSLDSPVKLMS